MINPEWYSAELNHLKVHKELHESILRDIVRRLVKTDFNVSDSAAWQAEKLQQSGMVFDEVIAEIAKRTDKNREEIKAAFVKASTDIFDFDDKELADAGYDAQQFKTLSPAMKRIVNAAYKKTFTEARNLSLTTAVTSQTAYIQAADLAYMKVESGAFTFQEAMRTAVKSAAVQGLNVVYPSGHVSSLDAAMRRALLTGLNQTTGKLQIMRAEELDNDIMEISAHYGARPSHAEWQGQLVSLSGQKGFLTLDDIGYGAVDGFMGANCRHSWNVFFYGLSKPRYSAEELEYYKNAEVEYNGEKMKAYEAQQKQRSMERAVKQSKSTLVAYDEAKKNVEFDEERSAWMQEFEKESVKLKNREAKLVDFCEQTGLQRDRFREQVFAANTMNGVKGFGKSTSAKNTWAFKKELTRKKNDDIIKEIKACGLRCETVNLIPKKIDADSLSFDDEHINGKRNHNVTREQAIEYIKNAKFSATAWRGKREKYFGYEGVAYVDVEENMIKTAFSKDEFDDIIIKILEVYKKYER